MNDMRGPNVHHLRQQSVLAVMAGAILVSATMGGCPTDGAIQDAALAPSALEGKWTGSAQTSVTNSVPGVGDQSLAIESELEVRFDANGRPLGLVLPVYGQGVDGDRITADIAEVGQTRTYKDSATMDLNGQQLAMDSVSTVTVREAQFSSDAFRIVYDYEIHITQSGAGLDDLQTAIGTSTYEGRLEGDALEYTQQLDQDITSSAFGMDLNVHQSATTTATLARE